MGFDPDQYLSEKTKPSFNPDAYLEEKTSTEAAKKTTAGEAALEHFGNAAALGYLPQLQGMSQGPLFKLFNAITNRDIDPQSYKKGGEVGADPYLKVRDDANARMKLQEEEHPTVSAGSSLLGSVTGGIALSGILPAATAANTAGQAIAKAAASGAMIGGAANPGDIEGEINPFQGEARLKNAAISGAISGGIGAVGEGIKKGGQVLADKFQKQARLNAVRASGANKADMAAMNKTGGVDAVGKTLLEEDVIPVLGTPNRIAKRLSTAIDKKEEAVSGLIKEAVDTIHDPKFISNATPEQLALIQKADIKPKEIASRLIQEFKDANPNIPEEKLAPAIKEIETWLGKQPEIMPLDVAHQFKRSMNKFLKDSDYWKEVGIGKQGTLAVQGAIRHGVEDGTDAVANVLGKEGGLLKSENRAMGNLLKASEANSKKIAGDAANRTISLSDTIVGAGGMAAGGDPISKFAISTLLAGANKFGRTFGDSIAARSENAIARALSKYSPEVARKISESPAAVAALVSQQLRQDEKQQEDNNLDPIQRRLVEIQNKGRAPAKGNK